MKTFGITSRVSKNVLMYQNANLLTKSGPEMSFSCPIALKLWTSQRSHFPPLYISIGLTVLSFKHSDDLPTVFWVIYNIFHFLDRFLRYKWHGLSLGWRTSAHYLGWWNVRVWAFRCPNWEETRGICHRYHLYNRICQVKVFDKYPLECLNLYFDTFGYILTKIIPSCSYILIKICISSWIENMRWKVIT